MLNCHSRITSTKSIPTLQHLIIISLLFHDFSNHLFCQKKCNNNNYVLIDNYNPIYRQAFFAGLLTVFILPGSTEWSAVNYVKDHRDGYIKLHAHPALQTGAKKISTKNVSSVPEKGRQTTYVLTLLNYNQSIQSQSGLM